MFKKIVFLFFTLFNLCGCELSTKLETYNEYHNLMTNFVDYMNDVGHQNLFYDISISGDNSLSLFEYQYVTAKKDNSYIFVSNPAILEVYQLEENVMYKYYVYNGGYYKESALKKDYEEYMYIENFEIPRKFSNKISKNDNKYEFNIEYKKMPSSFKNDMNKMFANSKINCRYDNVAFVYEFLPEQLNLSLNIDFEVNIPVYDYFMNILDYKVQYGTLEIKLAIDYKPFEKYLFDDLSNIENYGNSSIDNVTSETNLFNLFYVNSGDNYFKCNFQKGYYKVVSDLSYSSFDIQIYDQDKN